MKTHTQTRKWIAIPLIIGLLTTAYAERMTRPERAQHGPARMSLEQAIEQAKTPQDHAQIAARYEKKADKLRKSARYHERLAELYAKTDNPKMAADSARHCRAIAEKLKAAAEEMQSLAQMHREMGGQ
ncbi:hypothetical protein JCM13664_15900 [Methylothermus subterraneus]